MANQALVHAIIPARSGSKGVPHKNIRPLAGHPLLAWSIAAAQQCQHISRVIVSTDSQEYASIAQDYGAEAPFLRPANLAGDGSPDSDFFLHAQRWLSEHGQEVPDIWVHLRPTTPLRDPGVIDAAIELFLHTAGATSLRSAHQAAESPAKWFRLDENGMFRGLMGDEWLNQPRQQCPKGYNPNGYVDLVKTAVVEQGGEMYFPKMLAYITPETREVDTQEDIEYINYSVSKGHALLTHLDSHRITFEGK